MAKSRHTEMMEKRIQRLLDNRMGSQKMLDSQLERLQAWHDYYKAMPSKKGGKIKTASIWSSLFRLRPLALYLNKPFEEATTEELVRYHEERFSPEQVASSSGSKTVIRQFYAKFLKLPELVSDPRLNPENLKKNKIRPKDLPSRDEILKLLEACPDYRSKSIVMLCYGEAGMRAGEIVTLTRDSLEFDSYGAKLWINRSKSNERYVRLIDTEPYLRRYIELEYRMEGSHDSIPLFYGQHRYKGEWLLPGSINQVIGRAKKKSGITRRLWCHGGRHTSISRCHKMGMDVDTIAKRHGITAQTVRSTYLHFSDKDVDEAYLKAKGVLTESDADKEELEKQKLSPVKCPRCNEKNPNEGQFCSRCGMPLSMKVLQEAEQDKQVAGKVLTKVTKKGLNISKGTLKELLREMIRDGEIEL